MAAGRTWLKYAPDSVMAETIRLGRPAWSEFIHVLWTVWVFVVPMFTPRGYDLLWLSLTLLSYPLFIGLYAGSLMGPMRYVPFFAIGMIVLSMALLPWYPSGLSYFVFGCVMLGSHRRLPMWAYFVALVFFNAALMAWARTLGYPWSAFAWMPVTSIVIGLLIQVDRGIRVRDAALKLSHDEVRRLAGLAERERIGRDLHDLLGHTLSLVALKADLAGRLIDRDPLAARREIDELSGVARDALSQVRRAVSGIRAAGIAAELASARLLLETDGVAFSYRLDDAVSGATLPPGVETVLALTVREAVTNIQRHARATHAEVSFAVEGGEAVLRIVDDGRGGAIVPGNGLSGMRERLEAVSGRLCIDAGRGGTRIEARLPLAANDDALPDVAP